MLIHIMKDGSKRSDLTGCVVRNKEVIRIIVKEKDNAGKRYRCN